MAEGDPLIEDFLNRLGLGAIVDRFKKLTGAERVSDLAELTLDDVREICGVLDLNFIKRRRLLNALGDIVSQNRPEVMCSTGSASCWLQVQVSEKEVAARSLLMDHTKKLKESLSKAISAATETLPLQINLCRDKAMNWFGGFRNYLDEKEKEFLEEIEEKGEEFRKTLENRISLLER